MSSVSDYYRVGILPDAHRVIEKRAGELPILRRSHRGKRANVIGALGEALVLCWLSRKGVPARIVGKINHDMEIDRDTGARIHVDIKTKDRTVFPRPEYAATVPRYVYDKQVPHWYVFVSLLREGDDPWFKRAFIVGAITRRDFHLKKTLVEKGMKPNGANFFCEAWDVRISDLDSPETFLAKINTAPRSATA